MYDSFVILSRRECVDLGRVIEHSCPQHAVRPLQLFKGLDVCLHQVAPVLQPGKMEEALIARGATVSFQVHNDTDVLVTSLPYWDTFVSEAQVMPFFGQELAASCDVCRSSHIDVNSIIFFRQRIQS
jgi:hypothetical protein